MDAPDDLLDLRRGLLLGEPALLDQAVDLALGDVARLVEAGLDELVLDVLEHDGGAGGGDGLGDLAAHGAGADDGGLEHEHGAAGYMRTFAFSCHLGAEAPQRPLERLALRAADEQQVEERHPGPLLLERVAQLEGDRDAALGRREASRAGCRASSRPRRRASGPRARRRRSRAPARARARRAASPTARARRPAANRPPGARRGAGRRRRSASGWCRTTAPRPRWRGRGSRCWRARGPSGATAAARGG